MKHDQTGLKTSKIFTRVFKQADKYKRITYGFSQAKIVLGMVVAGSMIMFEKLDDRSWLLVALFATVIVFMLNVIVGLYKPTKKWVTYRTLSEDVKRATWLYAVHGSPYDTENTANDTSKYRSDLLKYSKQQNLKPYGVNSHYISPNTKVIRESSFTRREEIYLHNRAKPMLEWYRKRATHHRRLDWFWKIILTISEVTAIVLLAGQATGVWDSNLSAILGAFLAAGTSWSAAKKHPILANLYKNTVTELEKWLPELKNYPKEKDWGYLVGKYEEILTDATKKWGEFRLTNN